MSFGVSGGMFLEELSLQPEIAGTVFFAHNSPCLADLLRLTPTDFIIFDLRVRSRLPTVSAFSSGHFGHDWIEAFATFWQIRSMLSTRRVNTFSTGRSSS